MDWRRGGDSHETGAEAEDRSAGCAALVAAYDGRPFSPDLGGGRSESGSAATALASTPADADAHAHHESVVLQSQPGEV